MSTQNISPPDTLLRFSIIIPTFNEAADIGKTLDSLLTLDYSEYEILVVDESTDQTYEIVQSYSSERVRYMRQTRGSGRAAARNQGILAASGEIVLLLNADVRLPQDFLHRLSEHYQSGIDYLLVESEISNTKHLLPRYLQSQHMFYYGDQLQQINMNWTEGFSCRRTAAIDVGLVPEGQVVPLVAGEDGWFGERLQEYGYRKLFDREVLVEHIAPKHLREFLEQRVGRGHGVGQLWVIRNGISQRRLVWQAIGHTVIRVIATVAVVPMLWHAWRYANYSPLGWRDFVPFVGIYLLESWANLIGIWLSYIELRSAGVSSR